MAALTEPKYVGDWLKFEEEGLYCRKVVSLTAGVAYASGEVLATVTSTGKQAKYDGDGADGIDAAIGILVYAVDATAAIMPGVAIVRGPALINSNQLTFQAGQSSVDDIPEALADLAVLGILQKEGA